VPDCLVTSYEKLVNSIELPDPDDRHVVAATIVGHADAIVTFNTKDFPQAILQPYSIEVQRFNWNLTLNSSKSALAGRRAEKSAESSWRFQHLDNGRPELRQLVFDDVPYQPCIDAEILMGKHIP